MTLLKSTECIRGSAPPPPTHARAPPENLLPCAEAAVPALRPSGQLLLRCAGSRTSVEEVLIPRSNCRPTRCSQNVSEVPVVTDTTCRLHSILLLRRALAPSPTHPFPPPPCPRAPGPALSLRGSMLLKISHISALPCSRPLNTRSINSSGKDHDLRAASRERHLLGAIRFRGVWSSRIL